MGREVIEKVINIILERKHREFNLDDVLIRREAQFATQFSPLDKTLTSLIVSTIL
jgi:hypothetical protein